MTTHTVIDSPKVSPKGRDTTSEVKWLRVPAKQDYSAAKSYLSLNSDKKIVNKTVHKLAKTKRVKFRAKDILRASGLPLLPLTNPDVQKELARINAGQPLSPCLIVRGHLAKGQLAQIADGYHRICASNYIDEDAKIPVRIIDLR